MDLVSSRAHGHVHHSARRLAEFRREGRGLNLEFLDGVDYRLNNLSRAFVESHDPVLIVDAVEQVAVLHRARPVRDERIPVSRSQRGYCSRSEDGELNERTPIQRQVGDGLLLHHLSER